MKKYILLIFVFGLWGCNQQVDQDVTPETKDSVEVIEPDVGTKSVKVSPEGGVCGGADQKKCAVKLECMYEQYTENAVGKCIDPVVDKDVECPQTQAPVCGLKGKRKNGYLNECEAKRHGAEILDKGLCKMDQGVLGNCKATVRGIGTCDAFVMGYEFNGEQCVAQGIFGCEAELPFQTRENCVASCEGGEKSLEAEETTISEGCAMYFDGCNNCTVVDGKLGACTRKFCPPEMMKPSSCVKWEE